MYYPLFPQKKAPARRLQANRSIREVTTKVIYHKGPCPLLMPLCPLPSQGYDNLFRDLELL